MSDIQLSARALESKLGEWRTGGSAYRGLADRIRLLALDGRLTAGTRLPAERELGVRLGLSRTTVTAAYRELRSAGLLSSVRGSGSVVRLPGSGAASSAGDGPGSGSASGDNGVLDLSKATMSALGGLADVAARAAEDLSRHLDGPGFDPVGIPELRAAIAERYRVRGLPTDPEQIMVTIGAQHAIALLARVFVSRGDRVLIEQPSYPHAVEAFRAAGARLVPVSVTARGSAGSAVESAAQAGRVGGSSDPDGSSGWDEPALLQALRGSNPVLGYLMPDFHNPTGQTMPAEQRTRVIEAAARQGTVLIADETMGELGMDRPGDFMPFAAYAPGERGSAGINGYGMDSGDGTGAGVRGTVVTVGSVGKTIWGGLRIGWIRAEPALIRRLVAARTATDMGTPILEQLIVTRMLPEMPAILERRSHELRAGRDHLEALLAARFPDWTVPHVDGGLTAWVNLGRPVSSQLALAARNHGLLVPAGPRFGVDGAFERFLRVPFCHSAVEMERAVDALGLAWGSLLRHPLPDTGYLADVV
ncbi:PLP-dependent aminotransferase family protein [Cryobacterium sp. 5B3]|uniref:aminotransferase-like domain-containing protein n=1 Tax=Cryobacterium sp. 5B3 TaxID=3048586 RepID=UPI002AB44288|nr:PLP-dependent aminotransferase family protein [Cryobacterium sp. 5B3]MDY7542371.1 PLP-dependent aminotransferase family protein [Cryobacterium sp. 5B3]MEB0275993.1 PLP-dependent aminotransferase family protein [Cryobacterium sp. 5B3]